MGMEGRWWKKEGEVRGGGEIEAEKEGAGMREAGLKNDRGLA